MQYLVAYYKNGREHYLLSASRNAIQHCKETKAKQVQIYDKEGWLLSMANRNEDGEVYRPKLYLDGETKAFYAKKFVELTAHKKGGSTMNHFEQMEIGHIVKDTSLGCEWIVREKIPGGVRLQVNKEGGPFMEATPDTCNMQFTITPQFFELTRSKGDKLCILAAREPSLEEATEYIRKAYSESAGNDAIVVSVKRLSVDEAKAVYDVTTKEQWPIFGLSTDLWPVDGRRIWSRENEIHGTVLRKSRRYCAACQRVHDSYDVQWANGMKTKSCTAGVEVLDSGDLHIV